jgi:hypothetical protein
MNQDEVLKLANQRTDIEKLQAQQVLTLMIISEHFAMAIEKLDQIHYVMERILNNLEGRK